MNQGKSHVNILLHGLFFMEFGTSAAPLTLTAPAVDMHFYCCGTKGALFQVSDPGTQTTIDLRSFICDLDEGTDNDFRAHKEIPQFSKTETGTGQISQPGALRLLLGIPEQIIPLRRGLLSDFDIVAASGRAKDSIMSSCAGNSNQFALVTCLRYKGKHPHFAPPNTTLNFYAEHKSVPSPDDMNSTYYQASTIFSQKLFDLRFNGELPTQQNVKADATPGYGIDPDDERSLAELLQGTSIEAINIANCVQFGVNG